MIYIQYRTDGTEGYYRSPIIRASDSIDPGSMETLNFDCGGIEYVIDFERLNWWEGAEAQVGLATAIVSQNDQRGHGLQPGGILHSGHDCIREWHKKDNR